MIEPKTILQQRYRIERQLGSGGQGAVYKAHDQRLNLRVALKQVFSTDPEMRQAFEHEAQMLARLKHDALPKVIDHFTEAHGQFLVMEYIPGADLAELLKRRGRPFPLRDVFAWGDQLLDVLDYLHTQQPAIVHRDIKPHNLKLNERGRIILLDFGLAKQMSDKSVIRGYSRSYSPPEQIRLRGTDARGDIYSAAATLYHLMTGAPPHEADSREAMILSGEGDPLEPAHKLNARIPEAVSNVLSAALSLKREARPSSALEMRRQWQAARPSNLTGIDSDPAVTATVPSTDRAQFASTVEVATQESRAARAVSAASAAGPGNNVAGQTAGQHHEPGEQGGRGALAVEQPRAPRFQVTLTVRSCLTISVSLGLLFLVAGAIPFLMMRNRAPETASAPPAAMPRPGPVIVSRLFLEVQAQSGQISRASGIDPLPPHQGFKFHFLPERSGYLYIVATGRDSELTTLLTAQPDPAYGPATNRIEPGSEFVFPRDSSSREHWIGRTSSREPTIFTLILSPEPLAEPAFFNERAGRRLTASERASFEEFSSRLSGVARAEIKADQLNAQPTAVVEIASGEGAGTVLVWQVMVRTGE